MAMKKSDTAAEDITGDLAVETFGVSKSYGQVRAVDEISVKVESGQYFVLLGPSGGGKTTLLRLIGGFVRPDAGRVLLHGQDVSNLPPNKRSTSMVFQSYALFPHMSVEKNVSYGLKLLKLPAPEIAEKVASILELVGLKGYNGRMPHELSGGQQQRVQLARSLVLESDILLLDEPLASLDANLRKDMCHELKRIQEQVGITFIHVTHNQEEALTIADRIAIIADGKMIEEGVPKEIYEWPRKKFTADFIGQNNLIDGKIIGIDGNHVTIDLGFATVTVPRSEQSPDKGAEVTVSVPAEMIEITKEAPQDNEVSQFLQVVYEKETYLGFGSQHQILLPDGNGFVAMTKSSGEPFRLTHGDIAYIVWPTAAARLHTS